MRLLSLLTVVALTPAASAQERFVERTPSQIFPQPHTMSRAGNSASVAWWATPSVGRFDTGGYVGGAKLFGSGLFSRGASAATGPTTDGTFGLDFTGFRTRPGRVFLASSPDPSRGTPIANGYRTDGPHVPDVFAARPLRKAILEKKEAKEERKHER